MTLGNEYRQRLNKIVRWELQLASDHVEPYLNELKDSAEWNNALPSLLGDFELLLLDCLELRCEFTGGDEKADFSYWDLPSISDHWQNRKFNEWVSIIHLLRDSWMAVKSKDASLARSIATEWWGKPYPTFKRLALFAASQDDCLQPSVWIRWLTGRNMWWLWSVETLRETMRLLVLKSSSVSSAHAFKLEKQVIQGPPRSMYKDDLDASDWEYRHDREVWLRLKKLEEGDFQFSDNGKRKLEKLSEKYPKWELQGFEKDEFSHWMSGTGDPDYENLHEVTIGPRKRKELYEWLQKPVDKSTFFYDDNWREVCKTRFFHSALALCDLAEDHIWPTSRWSQALQAWSSEGFEIKSWGFLAPILCNIPDENFDELSQSISWWIKECSTDIRRHESSLFFLANRMLTSQSGEARESDDPVQVAINHPVGHIATALIQHWFASKPNDNDLIPANYRILFDRIVDISIGSFVHGRVILASRLIALFRIDKEWVSENLIPLLNWDEDPIEAKALWEGFLWAPRIYYPLLEAIKTPFLDTANHFNELGDHKRQFALFITYFALNPSDKYKANEFKAAISVLPSEGLSEILVGLVQALESSGHQREEFWINRVAPFWHNIWPKSKELISSSNSEQLCRLIIASGQEFPNAVNLLSDWLSEIEHPDFVIHRLYESELVPKFPNESLDFLDKILKDQMWVPSDLSNCLNSISRASPKFAADPRFIRLSEYARHRLE